MANNDRSNLYFGEGNTVPAHHQQYASTHNDNKIVLRPPPGLSPVPHFGTELHGNPLMAPGMTQQLSYPLMPKNTGESNFFNVLPPPGLVFFTPPQSPHFVNSSPVGNADHQFIHQQQGFVHPSPYSFPPTNGFHDQDIYDSTSISEPNLMQAIIASSQQVRATSSTADSTKGFIEPIIENIVSSSADGTYTHFGSAHPVGVITSLASSSNATGTGSLSYLISGSGMAESTTQVKEKKLWKDISKANINGLGLPARKLSVTSKPDNTAVQRPSTPISPALSTRGSPLATETTPPSSGKPSYLEILTKSMDSEKKASPKKTYASVSDSQSSRGSPTSTSGHPFGQIHNQVHRKLSDSYIGVLGSAGDRTSNSSASSSPLVKPKSSQLKGKENSFVQDSGNQTAMTGSKNSPSKGDSSGTPTKSNGNEWTKKVGSSKRSSKYNGRAVGYSQNMVSFNDGITSVTAFDFDIEDVDDEVASSREAKSSKKKTAETSKDKGKKCNGSVANGLSSNERRSSEGKNQNAQIGRKGRAEKNRNKKEERNCIFKRVRAASSVWIGYFVAILSWFWTLLLSVMTLSAALGYSLLEEVFNWWKTQAVPKFLMHLHYIKGECSKLRQKLKLSEWAFWSRKESAQKKPPETPNDLSELLSVLGPERNIVLPANGDEALQRLLSVKGKDPYSILGVRSDSSDDTIKRYYKRQAVLVHPDKNLVVGAEEAFKILARAFEFVGEPEKRADYHRQLLEAHAKERFMGEFGNLFEQLRKKMESVCTTIRCTKCNARHKKNRTDRPVFAARYCAQCRIHHAAREGELWAEKKGMFGFWQYYACMGNQVWEMNEWGKCQQKNLTQLLPDSHQVIYRLVSGAQTGQQRNSNGMNNTSSSNVDDDLLDPEMDDWDSLIHNLCRASSTSNGSAANGFHGPTGSTKKRKGKRK